jgi:hypothetical protein
MGEDGSGSRRKMVAVASYMVMAAQGRWGCDAEDGVGDRRGMAMVRKMGWQREEEDGDGEEDGVAAGGGGW